MRTLFVIATVLSLPLLCNSAKAPVETLPDGAAAPDLMAVAGNNIPASSARDFMKTLVAIEEKFSNGIDLCKDESTMWTGVTKELLKIQGSEYKKQITKGNSTGDCFYVKVLEENFIFCAYDSLLKQKVPDTKEQDCMDATLNSVSRYTQHVNLFGSYTCLDIDGLCTEFCCDPANATDPYCTENIECFCM